MLEDSARLTSLICGIEPLNRIWSPRATVQRMLDVEAALARALAAQQVIPAAAVAPIERACVADRLDADALARDAALGGNLAIPLVKQLTAQVKADDAEAAKFVHWGATSQDIIDTATVLQLRDTLDVLEPMLDDACASLATLARTHRATPMIGRTWLQQALPITLGLKFAQWLDALLRHRTRLAELRARALVLQFGGAAGTLASLRDRASGVSAALADELELAAPAVPWHTQRDRIAEAAAWFGMLIGTLGKIARDISLLMHIALGYFKQKTKAGEIGSSTMPHKVNPIDFENSEGNLGLANATLRHLADKLPVSRWQRDLTDSTVLRNMGVALGYSLLAYDALIRGLDKLEVNPQRLNEDLDNCWEVLAEPVQTVMRRYGIENPYEQLKELTRGKGITREALQQFIGTLAIPQDAKDRLLAMTPASYIGKAVELAKRIA
ncbi:adenylosuccinate lyase [Burkholderia multivorans]|nr:adenylosuccinate lyase [Burkholderia multivorans]